MMHYTLSGETTLSKLFLSPSDKIPKFNANNVDPDQSLDCLPMSLFIWDVRHKRFKTNSAVDKQLYKSLEEFNFFYFFFIFV